ncbi:MAG: hypothetical protein A2233_02820 [Candidatus Kerfeldbacteria bacterium RIFOXYA2_FULL_38_24]|uniref:Uncharacterized protein n=1 Tax=Candidatus Kerfeldbacteria bacterium RIFOXYB2_FULL_38_14 TaxID=1798547 RepID=A0A1G2BHA3_9BACT|nr:MAG: hypothetical protein A2233_02820 [Candidatus Kerfeldbacteria bacterium RIFOXYA2_FULL_38_24]OGY87587.1 MAG: hypothetical protein A2319_03215 [Candidatus Kerfeldbacteria bacterium RIFOXYB2_FULL_38_14]OGY90047.1 MAG: hypothetical protein A2458_00115 [Candidatus Kerfeldbacteria bacterium RIFOXYC2_FULL_38_9]
MTVKATSPNYACATDSSVRLFGRDMHEVWNGGDKRYHDRVDKTAKRLCDDIGEFVARHHEGQDPKVFIQSIQGMGYRLPLALSK